jgi:hypothetical protein
MGVLGCILVFHYCIPSDVLYIFFLYVHVYIQVFGPHINTSAIHNKNKEQPRRVLEYNNRIIFGNTIFACHVTLT